MPSSPASPKVRWLSRLVEVLIVLGIMVGLLWMIAPIFSSHPSSSAVRHWEANYSSLLPPGYSDFRGHWQNHDIGVQIFSFRLPDGAECELVLDGLVTRLSDYRVHRRVPGEVALRRSVTYSNPDGFDEYRFLCEPSSGRVYAMFANLDSEMDAHLRLVEQLHAIARGQEK